MTVCIAALCDSGKGAVIAVDKLITFRGYSHKEVRVERNDARKMVKIRADSYILLAGRNSLTFQFTERAKKEARKTKTLNDLVGSLQKIYEDMRREEAFTAIVGHGGTGFWFRDYKDYYKQLEETEGLQNLARNLDYERRMNLFHFEDLGLRMGLCDRHTK